MLTFWSVKGGSGVTVAAAASAVTRAGSSGRALLVDLRGDLPAALGLVEPPGPGVHDWLHSDGPLEAVDRLLVPAGPGLDLLPAGELRRSERAEPGRVAELVAGLAGRLTPVVVDAGCAPEPDPLVDALAAAGTSLLVLRPCYLALRRARRSADLRPTDGLVVVTEPGRALDAADVGAVVGLPVRASIEVEPEVARAVDAGTLGRRVPPGLARSLRRAA